MLAIVDDDPGMGRLVLRAPPWRASEVLMRSVATAGVILAVSAVGDLLAGSVGFGSAGPMVFLCGLAIWLALFGRVRRQTSEIGIDGNTGRLWVKKRGCLGWFSSCRELVFDPQRQVMRFRAGGDRRVEVACGPIDGPLERITGRFTVRGVGRFDEVRGLAALFARRLGLGITIERDTLSEYRVLIGRAGVEPEAARSSFVGYRGRPLEAPPSFGKPPSFEEPVESPPPLSPERGPDLFEIVRREGDAWVGYSPRSRGSLLVWRLYGAAIHMLAFAALAAAVHRCGADAGDAPSFGILGILALGFVWQWWALSRPSLRWSLFDDRLEVQPGVCLHRGAVDSVDIELFRYRRYAIWQLWVRAGAKRFKLAETRGIARTGLESLAVEVGRALSAPVRIEDAPLEARVPKATSTSSPGPLSRGGSP